MISVAQLADHRREQNIVDDARCSDGRVLPWPVADCGA